MFMTFKPSAKSRTGTGSGGGGRGDIGNGKGMQQVAASDARHGTSRNRFGASRRPACTRCQVKKLRCTGVGESCDRCRLQEIHCVVELTPKQRGRRKAAATAAASTNSIAPAISSPQGDVQGQDVFDSSPAARDPLTPGPTPVSSAGIDRSRSQSLALDPTLSHPTYAESLPQLSPPGSSPQSPVSLPRISEILDGTHQRQQSPLQPQPLPVEEQFNPNNATSTPQERPAASCTCIADMLDIVQKLDDDYFRLSTLTFDQCLKVGKYLIFHCVKPMDCASCADESAAHTVVLIICDRVAQMMACLGGRLERTLSKMMTCSDERLVRRDPVAQEKEGDGSQGGNSASRRRDQYPELGLALAQHPPPSPTMEFRPKGYKVNCLVSLFDGATGQPGMSHECNTNMFSPDFQAQYSNEELLHMIRELARIQAKNMDKLLARVGDMPQAQRSQARMGRIRVLRARIEEAAEKMDEGFGTLLRNLDC